jgi:lipopolysaccharide/colanic/teichoic acid biosynthesis glycosyltransferase
MHGSNVLLYPHRVAPVSAAGVGAAAYGALNRIAALMLLVLFAPLLLYIAWRIAREDGSPSLFAHYRVGRSGELFRCLKFRTMAHGADEILRDLLADDAMAREEWERDHKLRNDPRITGFGRFLRRTSLDELPQLINVVRGEMNLVGPRPIVVKELRRYGHAKFHYLSVKPGMTGLWQVSGRNRTSYEDRVRLDRRYVEQQSLWLDCVILARTIPVVLFKQNGV